MGKIKSCATKKSTPPPFNLNENQWKLRKQQDQHYLAKICPSNFDVHYMAQKRNPKIEF